MNGLNSLIIRLDHISPDLCLYIDSRINNTLFDVSDAEENGEARFQITEGFFYDYEFSKSDYIFKDNPKIISPHIRGKHRGTISPNIYVGTLSLSILENGKEVGILELEVRSVKMDYRNDYRNMLEFITEKCTEILLQSESSVSHYFESDFTKDNASLYQKFAFVKSIIDTDEFSESIHRIISSPVTKWEEISEPKDIRQIRRFSNRNVKEFFSGSNRTRIPDQHLLKKHGLETLPEKIISIKKTDSIDTPENRFIKYALEVFLKFCIDINTISIPQSRLKKESSVLIRHLESFLAHSVFKKISRPISLKINSPILQKKEGYREILRVWLMFDLAARLIWSGGEDVYSIGKKDIATLYEYWLFFKLLELFRDIFQIEPASVNNLIQSTKDGLNLQLKQGWHTALRGKYNARTRLLNIKFNYNRSFKGKQSYPNSGSWSLTMRPDYTLSIWPDGINEKTAEEQELIVHIHFDAKYKIDNILNLFEDTTSEEKLTEEKLTEEKEENRTGIYKNADLLKMHAYKDAIRRTGGAYILYPGNTFVNEVGFHEIIPGLGAFPVSPSKSDFGISQLKKFILKIINHFENRASQRERLSYRIFDIYKNPPHELKERIPEAYNDTRSLIPDDTHILIGFCKEENWDWVDQSGFCCFPIAEDSDSLRLGPEKTGASYILLVSENDNTISKFLKVKNTGPRILSKKRISERGYKNPSHDFYLIFEVGETGDGEFPEIKRNITGLRGYRSEYKLTSPFSVTLTELMKNLS